MEISNIKPSYILDADQVDEVIHFIYDEQKTNLLYTKYRILTTDFKGIPISNNDSYIRIKSIWYADLNNGKTEEIIPYGAYDIEEILIAQNYVYFIKITDKDGDGLLEVEDYITGAEIWRVNLIQKTMEFCFDCKDMYELFFFETASDDIVVFRTGEKVNELVFIDIPNQQIAKLFLANDEGSDFSDFRFVVNEKNNPTHLLTKKWIIEAEPSSPLHTLNCITWIDLISQLDWEPII